MIRNIKEARKCLKATFSRAGGLTQRQRWLLQEMNEGLDIECGRLRETLGIDVFDAVTLDAAHNSLIGAYESVPSDYASVARVVPATDFKDRNVANLSGLANLATVYENSPYVFAAQSDEKTTYSMVKKGNLLSISLEAQTNDAIGAFKQQAVFLGNAAKNTVNELVLGTNFDDNPTMDYDSTSLWDSAGHANISTSAGLSETNLGVAIQGMMAQTGQQGEKLRIRPWRLLVSHEMAFQAQRLLSSAVQNNADTLGMDNAVKGFFPGGFIASPHLDSDATDWYIVANPATHPVVEVAFLHGNQEPEIMREMENTGTSFSIDAVTWKVRYVIGASAVDHRAGYHCEA